MPSMVVLSQWSKATDPLLARPTALPPSTRMLANQTVRSLWFFENTDKEEIRRSRYAAIDSLIGHGTAGRRIRS
jgi:hypothetical protein